MTTTISETTVNTSITVGASTGYVTAAITTHAALTTGVHGVGASTVDSVAARNAAIEAAVANPLGGYTRVVVVDAGGNGDYATLGDAMTSITDASDNNRYGVVVMPGVYTLTATFEIGKEGVDIIAFVPGTVLVTSAANLSNGLIGVGLSNAMTTPSLVSGIKFRHTGNNTNVVFRCAQSQTFNIKFRDCEFHKSAGSGVPLFMTGSGRLEFDGCVLAHGEVTSSARSAVNATGAAAGAFVSIFRQCILSVASSSATAACLLDSLGDQTLGISVYHCYLAATKIVQSATAITSFAIALSVLKAATDDAHFTNTITTPGNIVDTNL